jgi:hypothetical protein
MRMVMKVEIPTESGNAAFKNGKFVQAIQETMKRTQAEAAYFTTVNGNRGGYIIFDLDDVAKIPYVAEPAFQAMGAKIEFTPCFTPEELQQAAGDIEKDVQTFG